MSKEITNKQLSQSIEDLAIAVNQGFNDFEARFCNLETRFDNLEARFDNLEEKVDNGFKELRAGQENLELRFTQVAYSFELRQLDARVTRVEKKLEKK